MVNSKTRGTTKLLAFIMAFLMMAYGMFQTLPALAEEGGEVRQEQAASADRPSDAPRSEDKKDEQGDAPSVKQDEESKKYDEEDEQEDSLDGDKEKANAPPVKTDGEESNPIDALLRSLGGTIRAESTGSVSIPVNVSWSDNDDEAGERPSTLTYVLYALENGSLVQKAKQENAPTTGYTFSEMPERGDDGNLIVYYVAVSPITNYYITAGSNSQDVVNVSEGHAWSFVRALGDTSVDFIMTYGSPMMIDLTVIVEWDDEGSESQRPSSVPFEIHRDGAAEGEELALTPADEGTSEQTLPGDFNTSWVRTIQVYGKKDNAPYFVGDYSYYQVEHPEVDGYYLDNMAARYTTVSGHRYQNVWIYRYKKSANADTVSFLVQKNWDDNDDAAGNRPSAVVVGAYANGDDTEPVSQKVLTDSSDVPWTCTFELPRSDNQGDPITYTVDEMLVPAGYTKDVAGSMARGFTVTNSIIGDVDVPVQVVWNDQDNLSSRRPSSVFVRIYASDVNPGSGSPAAQHSVGANGETPWRHIFTLPERNQDGAILYSTVDASDNLYYDKAVTGNMASGFVITYTLKPEYESMHVPVSVIWNDNDDAAGKRPSSVNLAIRPDADHYYGTGGFSTRFDEGKSWTHTFLVPKNSMEGTPLTYTLDAGNIPSGYTREVSGNQYEGFVVTYTTEADDPEVETVDITVRKTWNDNGNEFGNRPETVTFLVFNKDVSPYASSGRFTETALTLSAVQSGLVGRYQYGTSEEGEQDCVISNLPKCDAEGNEIQYHVFELASTYKVTRMENNAWDGENPVEFENSPITLSVVIEKIWDDDNDAAGKRPDSITLKTYNDAGEAAAVTLSKEDATISQDGNRWAWVDVFADKNLPYFDKDGNQIEYNVLEDGLPAGYTCVEVTRSTKPVTYHLTNRYFEGPRRFINVHKEWKDEGYEGVRPAFVTVRLLADGDEVDSAVLSAENQWQHTFVGELEHEDGGWVKYEVVEDVVEGYESMVTWSAENDTSISPYLFKVTNTRIADEKLKHVVVNKVWDDDNNEKGKRPDSITVRLLADGKEVNSVKINKDTKWSCEFSGLPVYSEEGNEIYYDVTEDMVGGYSASFQKKESDDGGTLTYTLVNSLIKVSEAEKPSKKDLPRLGDADSLVIPISYVVIIASFVGAFLALRRRN